MDLWYPKAKRKPLGPQTQRRITPRIFIVHTIVGSLRGTDSMFRRNGFTGLESTFGLGGPGDYDGELWQWQALNFSADAQGAGNAYATSVETADKGDPSRPWSPAQLASLIDLGTWWAKQTDSPARIVTDPSQKGFGYHRLFKSWNPNNHSCPGDVRLRQYRAVVIPGIADRLRGGVKAKAIAVKDTATGKPMLTRAVGLGDVGPDVRLVQHLGRVTVDGDFGTKTHTATVAWQKKKKLTPDGVFGPACCRTAGWLWKG